jgi:drug/metabolite transporter (DMT)-like permease
MSPMEVAVKAYEREHIRWNQWAVFFIGSIGTPLLFLKYGDANIDNLKWLIYLSCFILSIVWVFAGLAIRASTDAWCKTIQYLEDRPFQRIRVYNIYFKHLKESRQWCELFEIIMIPFLLLTPQKVFSVTRLLIFCGILSAGFFFKLLLLDIDVLDVYSYYLFYMLFDCSFVWIIMLVVLTWAVFNLLTYIYLMHKQWKSKK